MNIWLINHYAVPIKFWPANRTSYFAKYLLRAGHNVRVIAASTVHNSDINLIDDRSSFREEMIDGIPYTYINCHQYSGNGVKRIFNMFEFPVKLDRIYKQFVDKPDVVLGSSLTPFACVEAIRIAKRYNVKSIVEIRDLWPETAVAYGMIKKSNPLLIPLYCLEKKLYASADELIFLSEGIHDYFKERGWETQIPEMKVHHINNGVDLEVFDYNKDHYGVEDEDLQNKELFKVVYTGSVRFVNNLGKLLDVAKCLKIPNVKFLIWGKGDELPVLKQRIVQEGITNVVFKGYVDKKFIPYITSHADLNLAHNEASPVMRFGVGFNKMFDYMAAGKPILFDFPSKYNPAIRMRCGIEVESPTSQNIAEAIEDFLDMDKNCYKNYCRNARKCAERYDFKNLTTKLLGIMTGEYVNETNAVSKNI